MIKPICYTITSGEINITKDVLPPTNQTSLQVIVDQYVGGGYAPGTNENIAANVYTTIINILNSLNLVMQNPPKQWITKKPLYVFPFAEGGLNAFYNRNSLIFCYKDDFYTALSPDIVAHELGHAILDSLRPEFWNHRDIEVRAFHEAFGDIVAMLSLLQHHEVINHILEYTNGDLTKNNIVSDLAANFGKRKFNRKFLRTGLNDLQYQKLKYKEPHFFSQIIFGIFYDMFVLIFNKKKLETNDFQAIIESRDILAFYLIQTVLNVPLDHDFFKKMAQTILWADVQQGRPFHDQIWELFLDRKIDLIEDSQLDLNFDNYYLNDSTEFTNDRRIAMYCCSGGREPLKSSPEYYKRYKPENNSGCCSGNSKNNKQPKKKIKVGYKV